MIASTAPRSMSQRAGVGTIAAAAAAAAAAHRAGPHPTSAARYLPPAAALGGWRHHRRRRPLTPPAARNIQRDNEAEPRSSSMEFRSSIDELDSTWDENDMPKAEVPPIQVVSTETVKTLRERLDDAVQEEEALERALEEARDAWQKSKWKSERLHEQIAAEDAANLSMQKALDKRKEREEREQAEAEAVPAEAPALPTVEAVAPPPPGVRRKSMKGLNALLRGRKTKKRNALAAVKKEVSENVGARKSEAEGAPAPASATSATAAPSRIATDVCTLPKPIFIISDCTGESAANTVRCALGQFEQCIDQSCPTNLVIFRFVNKEREIYDIFNRALEDNALVVTSLVADRMMDAVKVASKVTSVTTVDLWSGLLDQMEGHLDMVRSGIPLGRRTEQKKLSAEYFQMIEAVEYTRKQDDGAMPENWGEADILLLGVSRTGKTPLSIYLGQRGYKTANLPLVPINGKFHTPKQLFTMDPTKVIGLIIDPELLLEIRHRRMDAMGVERTTLANQETYDSIRQCRAEVEQAKVFYAENGWEVLDVTARAVEETAARVLRLLSDKKGPYHPRMTVVDNSAPTKCRPMSNEALGLLTQAVSAYDTGEECPY